MVQRKVPIKRGFQADHHKTETQDVKHNKGADLKKKMMKKSGSIKSPKLPGKPLQPSPPRQSPTTTPNYMKSTTSSDARKEQSQSQVSARNPSPIPRSSNLRRRSSESSKVSVSSGKKAKKTLLARTLTKNPSFKPARASAKKRCSVVLCEDFDAQRATCSSTLRDRKFPACLSLNPGGTESEGTSAIKVCPYTYCSLNGRHRAPLPPLKCFLSARRLMIKTQRSVKLGCLSPRRIKPVGDGAVIEEEKSGFFIEIYSKKEEDIVGNVGIEEKVADDQGVMETLSDAPIYDDFDIHEALEVESNQDVKLDEEESPPLGVEEEGNQDCSSELLAESEPNNLLDEVEDSEASDMEWQAGDNSSLHLGYDYEYSLATDIEPDPEADSKDCCFDELLGGQVSQESYAQSLNSDAFSSSDSEPIGLYDLLESLNSMETGAPVEIQDEESEPVCDEESHTLAETSFDNLNHDSLPIEDSVTATEDPLPNLEITGENAGCYISCKVKAENVAKPDMEDSALARFTAKSKKPIHECDELGIFNPRAPNFLPLEPGPEAEKVDLRHQDLDEKKSAEEWMVDYALRQVVTKLGPARKRKVALLVEAFEKVTPPTKFDLHLRRSSSFDPARPMQACS